MSSPARRHESQASPEPASEPCPSCGGEVATPFCPRCGERRASDRHYSLVHIGEEVLEHFAHLDGTVWRTLKTLVRRPGELTAAYMRGERMPYMKPLQLFVLVSVAYFVLASALHATTFDTPLTSQLVNAEGTGRVARMVVARLAQRKVDYGRYAEHFNEVAHTQAKSLIIVMVPAFALALALVEARRRRPGLQHVVFALHFYSVLLIILGALTALMIAIVRVARAIGHPVTAHQLDVGFLIPICLLIAAYLGPALRRAYGDARWWAFAKALVLVGLLILIIGYYRMLLFYTTYWAA